MDARAAVGLLFGILGWISIGILIGKATYLLVARCCTARDSTDLSFATIVALIGSFIGGTVSWSLRTGSDRAVLSLGGALLGALVLALVFFVITPI